MMSNGIVETSKTETEPTATTSNRLVAGISRWFLHSPVRLLILPYFVGVVWHCLHPVASVLTGDLHQPRRWYIDENSLDPSHFQLYSKYDLILQTKGETPKTSTAKNAPLISSLCHGIKVHHRQQQQQARPNNNGAVVHDIPCYRHRIIHANNTGTTAAADDVGGRLILGFDVAQIVPLSAGVTPVSEAIVLVVPAFVPFSMALRSTQSNNTNDKSRFQLQASILQLMQRLASPQTSPWLAKTIFIVAPVVEKKRWPDAESMASTKEKSAAAVANLSSMSPVLEATVRSFLDAYNGEKPRPSQGQNIPVQLQRDRLPMGILGGAILRNLLVLDMDVFQSTDDVESSSIVVPEMSEIRILPQGQRGQLPNMDLTFVVKAILDRSTMLGWQQLTTESKITHQLVELTVHPYHKQIRSWSAWLQEQAQTDVPQWCRNLLHLFAFESILAVGPYPPHTPALERGIDALTIHASFVSATHDDDFDEAKGNNPRTKLSPQQYPMELVQRLELVIRALSNLQERLHHSTSLYLLTSKDRFVKHEEYLIPNLLLVVPLLVRAIVLMYRSNPKFHPNFTAAFQALFLALAWTLIASSMILDDANRKPYDWTIEPWLVRALNEHQVALLYLFLLSMLAIVHRSTSLYLSDLNAKQSIQFMACLLATFIHVAIAFGHVALAFPSALLWTPLIAFPTFQEEQKNVPISTFALMRKGAAVLQVCFLLVICPFFFLVPHVFSTYTPYLRYVYVPLHFLSCLLYILPHGLV